MTVIHGRAVTAFQLRGAMWGAFALLLIAPMVAMRFTAQVNWGGEDFAAAALILGGVGIGCELVVRVLRAGLARQAALVGLIGLGALVWADAAVGIF